jgi:hypothetical protein
MDWHMAGGPRFAFSPGWSPHAHARVTRVSDAIQAI